MAVFIGLTGNSEGMSSSAASGDFGGFGVRPPLYLISQDYCKALISAGAIPVFIPPVGDAMIPSLVESLDGILFSGGVDINPKEYDEAAHPLLGDLDLERDSFELALFAHVWHKTSLPVLGVCRGLQLLNVALGGSLWQDLPSQRPSPVHHSQRDHRYKAVHPVRVDPESYLGQILPKVIAVNSLHHQGIKDLAPGLRASAWSPDGLVEGVEAVDHPCRMAVQWHPENLAGSYPEFLRIFERFIDFARQAREARVSGSGPVVA
ncbi:MAG: gamma-glutamyl-gamma-aminobutyrate hydrolase family protein [Candidatus Sericytochromatia bacterium]|nr:gamma-glutamyl-gamma-aminobutyrate hydrolase family protein [Candidatus Sericytochromatia bacterium]